MTGEAEVLIERHGRALWLTLNRPAALNALNLGMVRTIHRALWDAAADPDVERVVITGAGDRAFCAGGDVALLARRGRDDKALYEGFFHDEYRMNQAIARLMTPYVAILDGVTMGGGVGLSIHGRSASPPNAPCSQCPKPASALSPMSAAPMRCRAFPAKSAHGWH